MSQLLLSLPLLVALSPLRAQDAWSPSPEEAAVYRALSARDAPAGCAEVEALASEPLDALRTVVERATMPPWAPMRAARCIVTHHAEPAREDLSAWLSDESKRGLGLIVLDAMDELPELLAVDLTAVALKGPMADDARQRLADSDRPAIRALISADGD
jgi:hypothetical protein